ncbi:DoxX family membrane protein [uncultured Tateyamaria sp.]|uniref:DoxX family membrane protein n=1 Tax=Tateyamaria sp. 1078 TaxID=3417464 RepID=UPI0026313B6B|nr:DoxX family membrane protein [uncultured Tateyamaria sp.]
MTAIARIRSALFDPMDRGDWLLPTLARVTFLAVFFFYFLNSAGTKIDGGLFSPSAGAFAQIFPKAAEAVLYDVTQLTGFQRLVIFVGTLAEYVLPVLIVVGLFTRLAAAAMIGFVIVQTAVDVTGHGVALGTWFNNAPELIDQRTLWVFLLLVLVIKGAGPLAIDRALAAKAA